MRDRERIQRQQHNSETSSSFETQPQLDKAVQRGGQPLDAATRNFLEPKFGHNFENVQIHADSEADMLSQEFGARAFTTGPNIFFRAGEFDPTSNDGLHLLAHELTHTVQQRLTSNRLERAVSSKSDGAEGEARAAADAVIGGQAVSVMPSATAVVSRFELNDLLDESDQAPGKGDSIKPYIYSRKSQAKGGIPGGEAGAGFGHSKQEANFDHNGVRSSLNEESDLWKFEEKAGSWKEGDASRYGIHTGVKTLNINTGGEILMPDGRGAYGGLEVGGPSLGIDAWAGEDGVGLGGQINAASVTTTLGTKGTEADEEVKVGLSEGAGAGGRLHFGDSDKEGYRQYGAGIDVGPLSLDLKTEDPIGTALRGGRNSLTQVSPLAHFLPDPDEFLGKGNSTEKVANQFGLSIKDANLDTTLDVIKGAADKFLHPGSPFDSPMYKPMEVPDLGSLTEGLPSLKDVGIGQPLGAPLLAEYSDESGLGSLIDNMPSLEDMGIGQPFAAPFDVPEAAPLMDELPSLKDFGIGQPFGSPYLGSAPEGSSVESPLEDLPSLKEMGVGQPMMAPDYEEEPVYL